MQFSRNAGIPAKKKIEKITNQKKIRKNNRYKTFRISIDDI